MAYQHIRRKMVLGYPFTKEWATEYALQHGWEQDFVFCTAISVIDRASSSAGESPRFLTIRHKGRVHPFFAVESNDPNDCIFPSGTQAESILKLKEIMGMSGPPTWYPVS